MMIEVTFLFDISWLSSRYLKLDKFKDGLFISSLLNLAPPTVSLILKMSLQNV